MNRLKGFILRLLLPSLILFLVNATLIADPLDNYWQQQVDYEMSITLHDSVRQITGNSVIKYTNQSPDSLDRIYMHLYPNAFQIGSVKYREYLGNAGRGYRAKYFKEKLDGFMSKVEIHDMSIALPDKEASWIHKIPILKKYDIDVLIISTPHKTYCPPLVRMQIITKRIILFGKFFIVLIKPSIKSMVTISTH